MTDLFNRKFSFISLGIIFILFFVIAYLTPTHWDDFWFYELGASIEKHLHHYMIWSGRAVIDGISSSVLLINNHFIISLINTVLFTLLIYGIATIPNYQPTENNSNKVGLTFTILFCGYWLANPALGETTFWIVGASNYVWPLVFLSFYIKKALTSFYKTEITISDYCIYGVLAFFSATNEANGILCLFITFVFSIFAFLYKLPNRKLLLLGLVIVLISYSILIVAPGNYVRASHESLECWREMSLTTRLNFHFTKVLPVLLKEFWVVYILLVWAVWQGIKQLVKQDKCLILLFVTCFVGFCMVLIASPSALVPRTHLTGLYFLLVVLSFLLKGVWAKKSISIINKGLLLGFIVIFFVSYVVTAAANYSFYLQNEYRLLMIEKQKQQGQKVVTVPDYYKRFVFKNSDLPSLEYYDSRMAGKYFGVEKLNTYPVYFDYGKFLFLSSCPVSIPKDSVVQCIYLDKKLLEGNTDFIIKFDPKTYKTEEYKNNLQVRIYTKPNKNGFSEYEVKIPLLVKEIDGHFIAVASAVTDLLNFDGKQQVIIQLYREEDNNKLDFGEFLINL